ncbi:MAG: hypothetical protein LBG61_00920 [Burkholderiales bacterium]|jgi:S-formylglutathione hydrolase FrmB|nr:hypothetical protein [Burkholderiales bacterium]
MSRQNVPHVSDGRLVTFTYSSNVLSDNPLQDPAARAVTLWLPPSYDQKPNRRFPVLFALAGFMSSGRALVNWRGFDENLPERAARLVRSGAMRETIIVFPDCFTSLGGNQYINSSAIGRYSDYLTLELVPLIDREFKTLAHRDHRGIFGHSSGGFGALWHAMNHPDIWGACASHAGDMFFETCYLPGWAKTLTQLMRYRRASLPEGKARVTLFPAPKKRGVDDGRVAQFLSALRGKSPDFEQGHALMDIAMAASYDPDPSAPLGFRLPFDLDTAELLPERWRAWQRFDPVRLVSKRQKALSQLNLLYFDCGRQDQYAMQFGAELFARRLRDQKIKFHYETFNGTHSHTSYRMDVSLPLLSRAVAGKK